MEIFKEVFVGLSSYYVRLVHDIIHRVLVTFIAVATPLAASVLEPVVPAPARTRVSVVIAIVSVPADVSFTNVIAVPIGYATEAFAGIVHVRAVTSADGWYICFPLSPRTRVYAALWLFCGISLNHTAFVPSAVQFVNAHDVGVPSTGVTRVGEVANTKEPEPVSSVTALIKLALEGVARNVATHVPSPLTHVEIGRPVQLVRVPLEGVPSTGVVKFGDVIVWTPVNVFAASVLARVAEVDGNVIVVASVPAKVRELLIATFFPLATISL